MGDFDKFSGCQFGNLQVDPPINGGDLELANGCYGGRAGDTNVPCASYTSNDLDEILDAAKSMEMQKNPSTASGNLHVGPGLVVDDFKLAISRNGGGFGDMSVHSTPYPTSNNSYAVLDEAKSMVEQLIPHPQFPPASMKTHPHLSKSKDPLDLTQSFLQDDEKVPHDMPILPCEIAAGNSPNVSMFSQGLIKNDLPTGGALFTSTVRSSIYITRIVKRLVTYCIVFTGWAKWKRCVNERREEAASRKSQSRICEAEPFES